MNTLAFIVTEKCVARCRFCGPRCSPTAESAFLSSDFMNMIIDQAIELFPVGFIVFTGGEPLIKPDNLKPVIEKATENGIPTRIVTNGFWGAKPDEAERIAAQLSQWGLSEINISVDDYHQEFIPIESVVNCVHALQKHSITVVLAHKSGLNTKSEFDYYKKYFPENLVRVDENNNSNKRFTSEEIAFTSGLTQLVGWSAEEEDPAEWREAFGDFRTDECNLVMSSISINSQGRLSACCGLISRHIPILIGQDLNKVELKKAIETANQTTIWNLLSSIGPLGIMKYLKSKNPLLSFPDYYIGKCHACETVFSNEENVRILAENIDELRGIALSKRTILESNRSIVKDMTSEGAN